MGVLLPNYPEENVVKGETGTLSNVFQILQDLHLKQCQETNSDSSRPRASQTSTTDTTCTTTQLTPLMTYSFTPANQNTGMATPITSMSESSTASRTTMPAETTPSPGQPTSEIHQNTSHNRLPQYYVHVQQPTSQVCKPGESPALRKVKTPHNGKTSVSRFPLTKQDILSQYSAYFEGIGCFPGDLYKFHLKPDHQPARHASKKQGISEEVNEHTDWVHSNIFVEKALERELGITTEFPNRERVEHVGHFPTPMEMCMDDHLTQTTERTQQQHLQGKTSEPSCPTHSILPDFTFSHAEFLPGMESTPFFPGKQPLQGKEESMDTGTFTLWNIILNRYPALSTLTHQATEPGRVQQNFQQLKMESSNMEALPCSNYSAETTPQMETSKKGPRADSIQNGKDTTVTSSRVTPIDPVDDIQPPTRKCISTINVHSQDSHSSKTDQLKKSKVQGNRLTRLSHHINTGSPCDQKSLPRDLHKYWNDRETLSINLKMDTNMNTNCMTTIQHLMSEHCYGSISNRSAQPEENTAQKKYLTRLPGYNSTDQLCDRESQPTDLSESWSHKELLYNRSELINREQIIPVTHKEPHILSRPSKAMAHLHRHTEKEVHLLSGPSELQPVNDCVTQYTPREKDQDLPQPPDALEAQKLKGPTQIQ